MAILLPTMLPYTDKCNNTWRESLLCQLCIQKRFVSAYCVYRATVEALCNADISKTSSVATGNI